MAGVILRHVFARFVAILQYDSATDTWTTKADMPTSRYALAASAVDGRIYVIGGAAIVGGFDVPLSTVEIYDPAVDGWLKGIDLPMAREGVTSVVVNSKIYAIGVY